MKTAAQQEWESTFASMAPGQTIEVSEEDYDEATKYMPTGYSGKTRATGSGNVICTIRRHLR